MLQSSVAILLAPASLSLPRILLFASLTTRADLLVLRLPLAAAVMPALSRPRLRLLQRQPPRRTRRLRRRGRRRGRQSARRRRGRRRLHTQRRQVQEARQMTRQQLLTVGLAAADRTGPSHTVIHTVTADCSGPLPCHSCLAPTRLGAPPPVPLLACRLLAYACRFCVDPFPWSQLPGHARHVESRRRATATAQPAQACNRVIHTHTISHAFYRSGTVTTWYFPAVDSLKFYSTAATAKGSSSHHLHALWPCDFPGLGGTLCRLGGLGTVKQVQHAPRAFSTPGRSVTVAPKLGVAGARVPLLAEVGQEK